MNEALQRLVWDRAENTCEYCRLPQSLDVLPFQIDHIIAEQHHGPTVAENLAFSCLNDNLHFEPACFNAAATSARNSVNAFCSSAGILASIADTCQVALPLPL